MFRWWSFPIDHSISLHFIASYNTKISERSALFVGRDCTTVFGGLMRTTQYAVGALLLGSKYRKVSFTKLCCFWSLYLKQLMFFNLKIWYLFTNQLVKARVISKLHFLMSWNYYFCVFLYTLCKADLVGHFSLRLDGTGVRWDIKGGSSKETQWKKQTRHETSWAKNHQLLNTVL